MSASLSLQPVPSSIERAREFTNETLAAWRLDGLFDIASLVVTELVVNAFEHTRTAVAVDLQLEDGGVRISVRDGSRISRGRRKRKRKRPTLGRGLPLVSHLASEWGVEPAETGKVVWALVTEDRALEDVYCDVALLIDHMDGKSDAIYAYEGFRVYMIDEPSSESHSVGRAIVTAPDGSKAWLVWEANVRRYLRELRAPDDERWGAWQVGLPQPLTTTGTEGRAYFAALIPDLRLLWEAWRQEHA